MKSNLLISIAVPSYNYANFLGECLKSIQNQTYTHFEVLIADGGSKDQSLQIIDRFCSEDSRFKLISRSDQGQPDAIQKAFKAAKGDIMGFLNADDHYISNNALNLIVKTFSEFSNIDLVSFGGYYTNGQGMHLRPIKYRYHPLDSIAMMKYRTAVLQPATFWKSKVYNELKFHTNLHYSFDSLFFFEAYKQFSWLELNHPIAGYRLHDSNKSLRLIPERIDEIALFESIKFHKNSYRVYYLRLIAKIVREISKVPLIGNQMNNMLYKIVNSIAFLTAYRLPGI